MSRPFFLADVLRNVSIFSESDLLKQSCGAEIIYFRPRSAPAPAPDTAIYCHLKLVYNSSTILIEIEIGFSSS